MASPTDGDTYECEYDKLWAHNIVHKNSFLQSLNLFVFHTYASTFKLHNHGYLHLNQPLSCTCTMDVYNFKSTPINCRLHVIVCIWINSYFKHIHGCLHLNLTMHLPSMLLFSYSCLACPNYQLYKIDVVHVIPKKAKHGKGHQVVKIDGCHLKLHYSLRCNQISNCTKEAMFSIRMIMILSAQALGCQNSKLVMSLMNLQNMKLV